MIVNLCYKQYDAKMSLEAMKNFKAATGKDLWFTLLSFIESYIELDGQSALSKCTKLMGIVDFETAAQAFYCMIKTEKKEIPLEEIEDAMFRVGWLPTDRDGDLSEPWPLIMYKLACDTHEQFEGKEAKKPTAAICPEQGES